VRPKHHNVMKASASEQNQILRKIRKKIPFKEYCIGKDVQTCLKLLRDIAGKIKMLHSKPAVHGDISIKKIKVIVANGNVCDIDLGPQYSPPTDDVCKFATEMKDHCGGLDHILAPLWSWMVLDDPLERAEPWEVHEQLALLVQSRAEPSDKSVAEREWKIGVRRAKTNAKAWAAENRAAPNHASPKKTTSGQKPSVVRQCLQQARQYATDTWTAWTAPTSR